MKFKIKSTCNTVDKVDGSNLLTGNGVSEMNAAERRNNGGNAVARGIYPYRKFLGATVALGFAALMAWHVTLNTSNAVLSDVNLANIEALAQSNGEGWSELGNGDPVMAYSRCTTFISYVTIYDGPQGASSTCSNVNVTCSGTGSLNCAPGGALENCKPN